ncbi:hypothetical protein KIN20_000110 [Parelaphostrongylus tenuis]|uniref:Uncharacterized protein n=1 Tax=Parelaphostrongylus tenuis TaxID=148309 RepID=A0AAD5QDJ7_PARTN|nr:hypothetical protein KIN20_000110 [Parelaphostrongylus tenuis]
MIAMEDEFTLLALHALVYYRGAASLPMTAASASQQTTSLSQQSLTASRSSARDSPDLFLSGESLIAARNTSGQENEQSGLREACINFFQRASLRKDRSFLTVRFWNEMHDFQMRWIEKVFTSSFQRTAATSYCRDCWGILLKVYRKFQILRVDLQYSIQFYAADAIKFLEFLTRRGCNEVSKILSKFIITVVSRFLRKRNKMSEANQTWIQSREMLRLVCQSPTIASILLDIIVDVDKMKAEFKTKMTSASVIDDMEFICYVIEQMNDLVRKATERLYQCELRNRFAPRFHRNHYF